jgi:hypothetical protein
LPTPGIDLEQELVNDIADFQHDPLGYVHYSYPWGEGELSDSQGPRKWQAEVFEHIGAHLQNPDTRCQPCRVAVCSGHGIGKSAFIAMLTEWAMSTCEDCRVIATANTFTQLDTKTAPEAAKWFRLSINAHWWRVAATSIKVADANHERTWRADFIPWSAKNPQAFAGLHNKGKRIIIIFDEASEIDDIIWETITGAMSDEDTEIIWLAFGNGTQNTGRFFECFGRFAHRWKTYQIDAREVDGTNKAEIEQDILDFGIDSDFVRVRWLGKFPRQGFSQFIPSDAVVSCKSYKAKAYESLPKIGSCDVARFGDDRSVIGDRQGRKSRIHGKYRGLDTTQLGNQCIEYIDAEKPDAFVVDGDGIGAGVFDYLKYRGYDRRTVLVEFHGGAVAHDSAMYFNRRAEIWGLMRDAIKAEMELPPDSELELDLTGPKYGFSNKQQIQLERKEDMKKRGLASPDCYGTEGWMA